MQSHIDILDLWPSRAELHRDLVSLGYSITPMGVVRWGQPGRGIPAEWYVPVARAAQQRGFFRVNAELLHDLAAQSRTGTNADAAAKVSTEKGAA